MKKDEERAIEDAVDEIDEQEQIDKPAAEPTEPLHTVKEKPHKLTWVRQHKRLVISSVVLIVLLVAVLIVPFTRYGFVGMFLKKDVEITVVDEGNKKPVSGATVSLGRDDATTDAKGKAVFRNVAVGDYDMTINKKNYQSLTVTQRVPILLAAQGTTRSIKATGRAVMMNVTNAITGKPVNGATVAVEDATAVSDASGVANLVLSVKSGERAGTVKADNYNDQSFTVAVNATDDRKVDVKLTPSGKVYFLSKRTGTINIMSANLDGSALAVAVSGTGKETDDDTSLLPSPNWQYLVLIARRDGDRPKVYFTPSAKPELREIDGNDATFEPVGWIGDKFYYKTYDNRLGSWQNGVQTLVRYDAASGDRVVVDSTAGAGTGYYDMAAQRMSPAYIQDGKVVYVKYWNYSQYYSDKNRPAAVMSVNGTVRSTLKEIPETNDIYGDAWMRRPGSVVFRLGKPEGMTEYYEYNGGKVVSIKVADSEFYNNHVTYFMSPSGNRAFWAEARDGQYVAFVADQNLSGSKQVGSGQYRPYGWVGDGYVLYSKNQSELYVAASGDTLDGAHKISDYHKAMMYPGYGWGAGGLN